MDVKRFRLATGGNSNRAPTLVVISTDDGTFLNTSRAALEYWSAVIKVDLDGILESADIL
jgi:hypothetical protein